MKKRLFLVGFFFVFLISFFMINVLALPPGGLSTVSIPKDPNVFYGFAKVNGELVNGTLKVYVNDILEDSIEVINGKFGGSGVFDDKLTLTGANNDTIKFVLIADGFEDIKPIYDVFEEGKVEEITLNFKGEKTEESTNNNLPVVPKDVKQIINNLKNKIEKIIKTNLSETDIEFKGKEEKEITKVIDQKTIMTALKNLTINDEVREKLEKAISRTYKENYKVKVESKVKYYRLRDRKTGKFFHVVDISSKARMEQQNEFGKFVWIEVIPKEVARDTEHITFKTKPSRILQSDPVIEYTFESNEASVEYTVVSDNENIKDAINNIERVIAPMEEEKQTENQTQEKQQVTKKTVKKEPKTINKPKESEGQQENKQEVKGNNFIGIISIVVGLVVAIVVIFMLLKKK